jgi:hypothetical protein
MRPPDYFLEYYEQRKIESAGFLSTHTPGFTKDRSYRNAIFKKSLARQICRTRPRWFYQKELQTNPHVAQVVRIIMRTNQANTGDNGKDDNHQYSKYYHTNLQSFL